MKYFKQVINGQKLTRWEINANRPQYYKMCKYQNSLSSMILSNLEISKRQFFFFFWRRRNLRNTLLTNDALNNAKLAWHVSWNKGMLHWLEYVDISKEWRQITHIHHIINIQDLICGLSSVIFVHYRTHQHKIDQKIDRRL